MSKAELIDLVVKEADVSKKDADTIVFATVGAIMESIAGSDEVSLIGFGSFEPRARKARDGRNPQTGKTIKIPGTVRIVVSTQEDFTEGGLERLRNSNKARSGLST